MRFRSEVDAWFYLLVLGCMAVVYFTVLPMLEAPSASTVALAAIVFLGAVALPLWLLLGTHYTVRDGLLTIRSGPFRWRIHLRSIERVQLSKSMLSAPALSLRRLEIVYAEGRSILVSPRNRDHFLENIGQRLS